MDPMSTLAILKFGSDLLFQERGYNAQNALNQQTQQREDSAYQRKVADLKAAGLSPALALGAGATTSALKVGESPTPGDPATTYMNYQIQHNNVATSKAQSAISMIQAERSALDFNLFRNFGVLPTDPWMARAAAIAAQNNGKTVQQVIEDSKRSGLWHQITNWFGQTNDLNNADEYWTSPAQKRR